MPEREPKYGVCDDPFVAAEQPASQRPAMASLLVGQRSLIAQRRGRYVAGSTAHPDRMAPDLAATLIRDYTRPGDLVVDPFAGVGTTLIEAAHAGRDALGVDCDPGWVALVRANIALARRNGATGHSRILRGDATELPHGVPRELRGAASLILTAPPSSRTMPGRSQRVRASATPPAPPGRSCRRDRVDLIDGITAVLLGCVPLLKPGGLIVLVSTPHPRDQVLDAASDKIVQQVAADLNVVARRHAAHAVLRDGQLTPYGASRQTRPATTHGDKKTAVAIRYDDIVVLSPAATRVTRRRP
ncbi:DNA methyltransferase [Actinoplanes sp. NBC_00393]|uniref:TRM11 family SAM-dependent methyltransferase n=1 Tax=Actinoplanes sp. NBC_00393 TaxID=2975953 RepID=UPI002E2364A4